ncbi:MAG: hypothetical protein ABEJ22_03915 [Haloferacaceae archaeon]
MPSRRETLAGAGALGASAGLWWLLTGEPPHTDDVMLKRVDVSWRDGDTRWNGYLLRSVHGPRGELVVSHDPSYVGESVSGSGRVALSERVHERLERQFLDVEYLVGVCGTAPGDDCAFESRRVSRRAFNRLRLGCPATVLGLDDGLFVLDATAGCGATRAVEVRAFDFDRRHEGRTTGGRDSLG